MNRYPIIYNQYGSAGAFNLFTIYTTGICNWASFGDSNQNLIQIWNREVRDNILRKIPANFRINIIHYEPLKKIDSEGSFKDDPENFRMILDYVNRELIIKDFSNPRIENSEFKIEEFTTNGLQNPYIVLDFAHIYEYPYRVNYVKISGQPDETAIRLNCVRFGFLGNYSSQALSRGPVFQISDTGVVTTYIDRMINLGIQFPQYEPVDYLIAIAARVKVEIENHIKEIKGVPLFKIEHIVNIFAEKEEDFLPNVLEMVLAGTSRDDIITQLAQQAIQENIETIITNDPI